MHPITRTLLATSLILACTATRTMEKPSPFHALHHTMDKVVPWGRYLSRPSNRKINGLSLSSDGLLLAVGYEELGTIITILAGSQTISLFDNEPYDTTRIAFTHTTTQPQIAFGFSTPKGKHGLALCSLSAACEQVTIKAKANQLEGDFSITHLERPITAVKYSLNDSNVAIGLHDGTAQCWDAAIGKVIQKFSDAGSTILDVESITALGFTDNTTVCIGRGRGTWSLFDTRSPGVARRILGHPASRTDYIATDPIHRDKQIASAARDCTVKLWDLRTQHALWTTKLKAAASSLALHPTTKSVLVGDTDSEMRVIYNGMRGGIISDDSNTPFTARISDIAVSSDGSHVAWGSYDGQWKMIGSQTFIEKAVPEWKSTGAGEAKKRQKVTKKD